VPSENVPVAVNCTGVPVDNVPVAGFGVIAIEERVVAVTISDAEPVTPSCDAVTVVVPVPTV
jgi:hypothetical protein